jgi:hypothetical protein
VEEETGLTDLTLQAPLGCIDWYFRHGGQLIHKYCHFFLFTSGSGDPVPQGDEGIAACVWLDYAVARERLSHANSRRVLDRARQAADGAPAAEPASPD